MKGRCPFCVRYRIERRHREGNCTECPFAVYGFNDGPHKVTGCFMLLCDILGSSPDREFSQPQEWGLYFGTDFTWVIGERGRQSVQKILAAIEAAAISEEDNEGAKDTFEKPEEKAVAAGIDSEVGSVEGSKASEAPEAS